MVKEYLETEDIHKQSEVIVNEVMVTAAKASVPISSNEKVNIEQAVSEKNYCFK